MAERPPGAESKLEQILEIIYIYFKGDRAKVDQWLRTPNAMLENKSPMEMIRQGRPEKLLELVQHAIEVEEGSR
jgi:uncharacterized protein (DUF2384 family)